MAEYGWSADALCDAALRKIGVLPSGQTTSDTNFESSIATDTRRALVSMLDAWQIETGLAFAQETLAYTVTGAAQSELGFALGDDATLDLDQGLLAALDESTPKNLAILQRPVRILQVAHVPSNGYRTVAREYPPLDIWRSLDRTYAADPVTRWAYVPSHTANSAQSVSPPGYLRLWPTPQSGTLYISYAAALDNLWGESSFSTAPGSGPSTGTTLSIPQGYADAIIYNLACRMAPEFDKEPSPLVVNTARETLERLRSLNLRTQPVPTLAMPRSLPMGQVRRVNGDAWIARGD